MADIEGTRLDQEIARQAYILDCLRALRDIYKTVFAEKETWNYEFFVKADFLIGTDFCKAESEVQEE